MYGELGMTGARLQSLGSQIVKPDICAFAVYLDGPQSSMNAFNFTSPTSGTTVPYNLYGTELYDHGGDYDLGNNKFVAPIAGLYHFSYKLRIDGVTGSEFTITGLREPGYSGNGGSGSEHASRTTADIIYAQTYTIGDNNQDFHTINHSMALKLVQGQEIEHWVRVQSDTSVALSDRAGQFSGYFVG